MTARELANAEKRCRTRTEAANAAREARDATVRKALAEGWTQRAVAEATGLTPGRIGQIASR